METEGTTATTQPATTAPAAAPVPVSVAQEDSGDAKVVLQKVSEVSIAFRGAWHAQQQSLRAAAQQHRNVAQHCADRLDHLRQLRESLRIEERLLEQQYSLSADAATRNLEADRAAERDVMKTMRALETVGNRSTLEKEEEDLNNALIRLQAEEAYFEQQLAEVGAKSSQLREQKISTEQRETAHREKAAALAKKREERVLLMRQLQERERVAARREESIEKRQRLLDARENDVLRVKLQVERKLQHLRQAEVALGLSTTSSKAAAQRLGLGGSLREGVSSPAALGTVGLEGSVGAGGGLEAIDKDDDDEDGDAGVDDVEGTDDDNSTEDNCSDSDERS